MSDPQTPPTPPLEHARRNALGCMSCQHGPEAEPGNECEACRRVVADFESEVRADERAALAASAGPLSAERLNDFECVLRTLRDVEQVTVTSGFLRMVRDLLTAYTALAAECALVKEQRDHARELHRDALVEYGAMVTRVNAAEADLAALRATVAQWRPILDAFDQARWQRDTGTPHGYESALRAAFDLLAARTPTPEGQG